MDDTKRMTPEEWRLAVDLARESRRRGMSKTGPLDADDRAGVRAQREAIAMEPDGQERIDKLIGLRATLLARDPGFLDLMEFLLDLDEVELRPERRFARPLETL